MTQDTELTISQLEARLDWAENAVRYSKDPEIIKRLSNLIVRLVQKICDLDFKKDP